MIRYFLILVTLLLPIFADPLLAAPITVGQTSPQFSLPGEQTLQPSEELGSGYPDLITQAVILVLLALAPFLIMLLTSFMKIIITLALLRSAMGTQQTPPNQILNGIALVLTIYVMYPTGLAMYQQAEPILKGQLPSSLFSKESAYVALQVVNVSKEPMRDFLIRNSGKKQIEGFLHLAQKTFPESVKNTVQPTDFIIAVPSFIVSQIKSAFEIGVLIYIPFFVIDLVTSNILLAMQMMMLSPLSISLPLKLLLLVMVNGWSLILEGLVLSFR